MFANRYYEQDIKNTFEINRFLFRMLGMWPFTSTKSFSSTAAVLIAAICFTILLIEYISSTLYIFLVIKDARVRLNVMFGTIYSVVAIFKYSYMLLSKDQVKNCLIEIDKDWQNVDEANDRLVMMDNMRSERRWLFMFGILVYTTGMTYRLILPLSKGKIVTAENITIRTLPSVAYFVIFDVQQSPAYEIVFFLQVCSGFLKNTISLATLSFLTLCVMHLCGQLNILIPWINNFISEQRFENLDNKLALIVKQQIKTQHFLKLVQNTMQYPNFVDIVGSTVFVCLAVYHLIMHWENRDGVTTVFTFCIVISMFSSNIFIICYMGEKLIEQGEKVALRMYTLEWYRLPDAQARSLILVIIMSYISPKLQGGKFVDISMRTFGNIIKTAMTYCNFLRTAQF